MKNIRNIILTVTVVILTSIAYAQPAGGAPPGGPSGGATPPCWPPPCIPVDGGVSILVALGIAYGGKKAYDFQRNSSRP